MDKLQVWDMRTKAQVHCLAGHTNTVADVVCQEVDPQVGFVQCALIVFIDTEGSSLLFVIN